MIVGLVLKIHQPLFGLPIYLHRHNDAAGIDLIRLLLVLQFPFFFQFFHGHQRQIHQAYKLVRSALVHILTVRQILPVSVFQGLLIIPFPKADFLQFRREGGMTAVVGPVSIQNPDLRHSRISLFLPGKIILNVKKVFKSHSQTQRVIQTFQFRLRHGNKTCKYLYILRLFELCHQCFRFFQSRFSGIYRVNAIVFDRVKLFLADASLNDISGGRAYDRLLIFFQKFHTLNSGIRSLVKLTRKILHRKSSAALFYGKTLLIQRVHRRLGKHGPAGGLEYFLGNILHIIADQNADLLQAPDPQIAAYLMGQILGRPCKGIFLFHIHSPNITHWFFLLFFRYSIER